jgi:putative intracellular protease/amidase
MTRILIPVTNHATLGDTDQVNGTYAPELTHVLKVLHDAGLDYDIVSIEGGNAPLYGTETPDDSVNTDVLAIPRVQEKLKDTVKISDVDASKYNAVFYPGGFGLLSDLANDASTAEISRDIYEKGGVISAVCHGPGALLPITLSNGEKLIAEKRVTGFTREEEVDFGTINDIPFLLEESLARNALRYEKTAPWTENVIVDGRLITGQNPQSAHLVGEALVKSLGA